MHVTDALQQRRSIRRFTDRAVSREDIQALLAVVPLAPNHRMTEPWRFYVLGPDARYAYGLVLGARKAKKLDDAEAGAAVRQRVADEHRALPAMVAIVMVEDGNPEVREENYAAIMMGVQNLALAAVERGLGTHIKTGAVMQDPGARAAVGVKEGERIVAIVNIGEPAETPPPKPRRSAVEMTKWV